MDDSLVTDQIQYAVAADVDRAVTSAETAFYSHAWSGLTAKERGRALMRVSSILQDHKEELAWLDRVVMGKPVTGGLAEVQIAADLFECMYYLSLMNF